MTITEITPPSERKFSLELTENELKLLTVIMGNVIPNDFDRCISKNTGFTFECIGEVKYEASFVTTTYEKLINIFER